MCGRLNVISDPLCQMVSSAFGIHFSATSNPNLCPSETASTLVQANQEIRQVDMQWGIQPSWAKRLLINAQSETVATKPTFANAFAFNRCLIPCSGWYEWRKEGSKKQKYYFSHADDQPLYMAGISFQHNYQPPQVVTLTTKPNDMCATYHHRMPVLVLAEQIKTWLQPDAELAQLTPLMSAIADNYLSVVAN
ncbi:Putative SOS response-associated peptidase YedK [Colwellia chukchiensis]|uniref:Abasic site processing protein n=1 Tax=Colwellia chukchiensis TaxID=641665 RepID=A0A1H7SK50_9GAMM|nr:SOS response-associated peptidase [Colwellia chukchiensis]SEL73051.1 Putative SOS response-associated peptidase YedK [Colwellia chukchiensis]